MKSFRNLYLCILIAVGSTASAQNSEKKISRHWREADSVHQHHSEVKATKKSSKPSKKAPKVTPQ